MQNGTHPIITQSRPYFIDNSQILVIFYKFGTFKSNYIKQNRIKSKSKYIKENRKKEKETRKYVHNLLIDNFWHFGTNILCNFIIRGITL